MHTATSTLQTRHTVGIGSGLKAGCAFGIFEMHTATSILQTRHTVGIGSEFEGRVCIWPENI